MAIPFQRGAQQSQHLSAIARNIQNLISKQVFEAIPPELGYFSFCVSQEQMKEDPSRLQIAVKITIGAASASDQTVRTEQNTDCYGIVPVPVLEADLARERSPFSLRSAITTASQTLCLSSPPSLLGLSRDDLFDSLAGMY